MNKYDDINRFPAASLPNGWYWIESNDGSGCLESPDKYKYFIYDLNSNKNKVGINLHYNHEEWKDSFLNDSLESFKKEAEKKIAEQILNINTSKSVNNMQTEKQKLAIVFTKDQCSKFPVPHRKYNGKDGKPLKMSIIYLPSEIYRPDGIDFGIDSNGIDRNDRFAFINAPWDAIKKDKNDNQRRFLYLNRDNYNIQFRGRVLENGQIEKIEPVNVSAKELENIFNWSRRKENKKIIADRKKSDLSRQPEKNKKVSKQKKM